MWTKICGNTNLEDALLAIDAGADAVGFVFAASPRRVTAKQVGAITAKLPHTVEKYGVFVDAEFDGIVATVKAAGLTGVQLHSNSDAGLALRLRKYFSDPPGRLGILQTVHYGDCFGDELARLSENHAIDAALVDSQNAHAQGGTGIAYDWQGARSSFFRAAPHLRLIAAGGLKPENVAEAIYTLQPWGVDVCSGVEAAPGKKDAERVRRFIQQARMAGAEIKRTPARV